MESPYLTVTIIPEAGGKITELLDRRTQRNWLWKNPFLPVKPPTYGANYNRQLDSGGWDEILLSVSPCDLDLPDGSKCSVPDHGDLVGQAANVIENRVNENGQVICTLEILGRCLPYRWRRSLVLDPEQPCLDMHYSLENTGCIAWPWQWCAHPLIAMEEGMRLELEEGSRVEIAETLNIEVAIESGQTRWPWLILSDGTRQDLGRSFDPAPNAPGFAAKIYVRSGHAGLASVRSKEGGERLIFRFDPEELPWIGLWINRHGWSGCDSTPYFNLGLEPSTSRYDSLAEAVGRHSAPWLQPGEIRRWSMSVEIRA